ncbi:hypothetical protein KZZ52_29845 [Dactylosporangium sp. AC04546]|uniref:hypothetical protein n=1 Tax=Dactylosporangium sp. AC04546 TaxID=2862460 RepID=UPI002E7B25CF|nr:hypothetical protein [Dactylosporangium sp. AC04546]WVK78199.1 hypothetical protein KZZ52_29845 [Dactylosporangium sp. AC04546]
MEIRQLSGGGGHVPGAVPVVQQRQAGLVEPVAPPPKGGLPASQQVLSKLTPGDRAAIAGATGYHLSPTGAVTNVGGVPPWSFIMAFAASRTAVAPVEVEARASSDDGNHVDVTV